MMMTTTAMHNVVFVYHVVAFSLEEKMKAYYKRYYSIGACPFDDDDKGNDIS